MENSNLHHIFLISEILVNPDADYDSPAWSMWLDIEEVASTRLRLVEVISIEQWRRMFELRAQIEEEFGEFTPLDIEAILNKIKEHIIQNNGKWFLAYHDKEVVGEIGVIPIKHSDGIVYRLQDVDILKAYRGNGYGNELLKAISNYAFKLNVKSLCLHADVDDWKKDWYLRYGFHKIGDIK